MSYVIDLTGQRFGRLTVIERVENDNDGHARWLCRCECGNTTIVAGKALRRGVTRSCGCLHDEVAAKHATSLNKTHGQRNSRLSRIWRGMKSRCQNPNYPCYSDYGGRGITVCDEWQQFEPFYKWAMANGYRDELSIDRIDVEGNYEPSNCRWVNAKTQANNKRNNHFVVFEGRKITLTQWAEETEIPKDTLRYRLRLGWSVEKALTTPVDESKRHPKK